MRKVGDPHKLQLPAKHIHCSGGYYSLNSRCILFATYIFCLIDLVKCLTFSFLPVSKPHLIPLSLASLGLTWRTLAAKMLYFVFAPLLMAYHLSVASASLTSVRGYEVDIIVAPKLGVLLDTPILVGRDLEGVYALEPRGTTNLGSFTIDIVIPTSPPLLSMCVYVLRLY